MKWHSPTPITTARSIGRLSRPAHDDGRHASHRVQKALVETVRNHFKKDYEAGGQSASRSTRVVVRVQEAGVRSRRRRRSSGSNDMAPGGPGIREFIGKFMQQSLGVYLHKNRETAGGDEAQIEESERERIRARRDPHLGAERAKKASLHNRKHPRLPRASWAIAPDGPRKARCSSSRATRPPHAHGDARRANQAVFALRAKAAHTYGLSKKVIYENEDFTSSSPR